MDEILDGTTEWKVKCKVLLSKGIQDKMYCILKIGARSDWNCGTQYQLDGTKKPEMKRESNYEKNV